MEQWKQDRLIDILDTLIDYRGKTPNKVECGIPLITAKIVKNGRIETPTEFLTVEDYKDWMVRGYPQMGDVVITTEAPLGEVAQLRDDKIALAQRIVCLRGKEGVLDNTYLKYFLMSNIGQYRLKASGHCLAFAHMDTVLIDNTFVGVSRTFRWQRNNVKQP